MDPDVDWPHALSPAQRIWPAVNRLLLNTKPLPPKSHRQRLIATSCRLQLPRAVNRAFPRDSALRASPSLPHRTLPALPSRACSQIPDMVSTQLHQLSPPSSSPPHTFVISTGSVAANYLGILSQPSLPTQSSVCQCPSPPGLGRCGGAHGAVLRTRTRSLPLPRGRHHLRHACKVLRLSQRRRYFQTAHSPPRLPRHPLIPICFGSFLMVPVLTWEFLMRPSTLTCTPQTTCSSIQRNT